MSAHEWSDWALRTALFLVALTWLVTTWRERRERRQFRLGYLRGIRHAWVEIQRAAESESDSRIEAAIRRLEDEAGQEP